MYLFIRDKTSNSPLNCIYATVTINAKDNFTAIIAKGEKLQKYEAAPNTPKSTILFTNGL